MIMFQCTPALAAIMATARRASPAAPAILRPDSNARDRLRIELHDGSVSFAAMVPVGGDLPEPVAVSQRDLGHALRGAKGEVTVDIADSIVTIRPHGLATFKNDGQPIHEAEAFIAPRPDLESPTSAFPVEDLRGALSCAASSMSNEETRYYLNGVYFDRGTRTYPDAKSHITLVGTDGHRLTYAEMPVDTPLPPFIMPRETVSTILTILDKDRGQRVTITSNGNAFHVSGDDWEVWGRAIEGFPAWRRVLPAEAAGVVISAQELIKAVTPMVKSFNRRIDSHDPALSVTLSPGMVRIETTDTREMRAELAAKNEGLTEPRTFGIDQKYLLESVKALTRGKTDTARIWQVEKYGPVWIQALDTDRAAVIVPVKLSR
jgi:DNA polymerase III sliding clamp (beta) subunit (PCNA family)